MLAVAGLTGLGLGYAVAVAASAAPSVTPLLVAGLVVAGRRAR
ncbi:hypothetical protein ACFS27_15740 [Promicromonospora vindobonensis]|uniref:Uncharacterized protein n=1 Tax=Promicromonospora vindobonensis TaxID=195748 RepID=A0ABW5VXD3_9MICO